MKRGEKNEQVVGNITSLPDLVARYGGRTHGPSSCRCNYRSPHERYRRSAKSRLRRTSDRLDNFARETRDAGRRSRPRLLARFRARLDDDFDTPGALAVVFRPSGTPGPSPPVLRLRRPR